MELIMKWKKKGIDCSSGLYKGVGQEGDVQRN